MTINLKGRHFLKLLDFTRDEIHFLLDSSLDLKKAKRAGTEKPALTGKQICLIFEKTSTRTRCAFEVAAKDQGAHVTYLGPTGSQIGHKESIKDTARVLGRMYDGIEYRGFGQAIIEELAAHAGVPVWNGLTNEFHPTQILADLMTMIEHARKPISEISFCYMGDARFNMGNSYLVGAAKMGMDIRIIAPEAFQPGRQLVETSREIARESGARISISDEIETGIKNVDFICTDVWVSMGEPESAWEERIKLLKPFQVNSAILRNTGNPDAKFLHCLPAFHNRDTKVGEAIYQKFHLESMEVTDDVFESEASIVFDEAENRMHTIKAILVATLGNQ